MKRYIKYILLFCLFPILWGACEDSDAGDTAGGKITAAFGTLHLKSFENVTPLLVPVVLSQPAPADMKITVEVKSEAGALEGVHYSFPSRSVIIAKGASVGYFEVTLYDDREVNPDRDFCLELVEAQGAVIAEGKDVCRITIQSDEGFPTIEFQKTLATIREDEGELLLNVFLGRKFTQDVTFSINARNESAEEGAHFTFPQTEFTIPAGDTVVSVPITIIDDIDINDDRVFWLELTQPVNAVVSSVYGTCKITIINDDTPVYVSFVEQSLEVFESDAFIDIPVKVEGSAKKPVTLTVKVTDETQTDLDVTEAQITLPVGVSTGSVKILLNDNDIIDKDRKYTLCIGEVINAEKAETDTTMTLTVMNDDLDYNKLYDELLGTTWKVEIEGSANANKLTTATFFGGNSLEEEDQNYRNTLMVKALKVGQNSHDITFKINYNPADGSVSIPLGVVVNDTGIKFGTDNYPCQVIFDGGSAAAAPPVTGRAEGKGFRKLVFDGGTIYAGLYPTSGPLAGTRWSYWFSITKITLTRTE